jgi:hypothetical protein
MMIYLLHKLPPAGVNGVDRRYVERCTKSMLLVFSFLARPVILTGIRYPPQDRLAGKDLFITEGTGIGPCYAVASPPK